MDKNKMIWLPICLILGAGVGALAHQTAIGLCIGIAIGALVSIKKKK